MAKKIVIVTSTQPALNPRLVKEADTLGNAGYEVTVLYSYWNNWGADLSNQLLKNKIWKAICVGGDPEHQGTLYLVSRLINKIAKTLAAKTKASFWVDVAISRSSYYLIRETKKHLADLYIGHTPGALPAVVAAARANNKPCGFDAEDFHRNERSNNGADLDVILKTQLEDKYLPHLDYFTTSSPQIALAYEQLYPALNIGVLLNVCPANNTVRPNRPTVATGPVKLFWFSQTIGTKRGLQDVIAAVKALDKLHFELHILGSQLHCDPDFISDLLSSSVNLKIHNTIAPDELVAFASQFDVGLALEPAFTVNNNLALSNKVFTYMQAGLAIIASDTAAQQSLMDQNPSMGFVYPKGNVEALAAILSNYHNNRALLADCQNESARLARERYNWEIESAQFLAIVNQTLRAN